MTELMDALLVSSVWMIVVALFGLDIMFLLYLKQPRQPQTVIVWDGWTTEVALHRKCMIADNGNVEVFGDGEMSLPMGLMDRAGEQWDLLLVRRQKVLAYV